jgi:hypothetical protein
LSILYLLSRKNKARMEDEPPRASDEKRKSYLMLQFQRRAIMHAPLKIRATTEIDQALPPLLDFDELHITPLQEPSSLPRQCGEDTYGSVFVAAVSLATRQTESKLKARNGKVSMPRVFHLVASKFFCKHRRIGCNPLKQHQPCRRRHPGRSWIGVEES